jgi:hypothetical protein
MAHLCARMNEQSIDIDPLGVCHFQRVPLEIRDEIYQIFLTTPYCTKFISTGTALEFRISRTIFIVSKQIKASQNYPTKFICKQKYICIFRIWI